MSPAETLLRTGQMLTVREAASDDAAPLLAYVEQIAGETDYLSFGRGEFLMTEEQERSFLEDCRGTENQSYLVGIVEGGIVGTIMFVGGRHPRDRHTGLLGVSVLRDYWARGVGSRLMDLLIRWAEENAVVTKLQLKVRTDNQRAINLYVRKGFRIEGTIARDFCVNHTYYDQHIMGRDV